MSESNTTPKKPSHVAYHVSERGDKSFWNRCGAAWPHTDGEGFNVRFESIPLNGQIVLRIIDEEKGDPDA